MIKSIGEKNPNYSNLTLSVKFISVVLGVYMRLKAWQGRWPQWQRMTLVLLMGFFCSAADADLTSFKVVFVSEMTEMDSADKGSYPRLASLLSHYRDTAPPVLFISGGGGLAPSAMSSLDMGAHIIDLLNSLEPVTMVAGKREFSFGEDVLSLRSIEAAFPVISSNLTDALSGENLDGIQDHLMVSVGDLTLGIVALLPPIAQQEYNLQRVNIDTPVDSVRHHAAALRSAGADRVILAYSCCYRDYLQDLDGLDQLLHDGIIDLALGKDEHLLLAEHRLDQMHPAHIWITEGDQVALVNLSLDPLAPSFLLDWHTESINDYDVDPAVGVLVEDYTRRLESLLSQEIGKMNSAFSTYQVDVRTMENPLGNLLADVMRWHSGAEIALVNGGYIRGEQDFTVGQQLTRRDILRELPFRDQVVLLQVSGATLSAALENGLSQIDEIKGRFLQVSGMQVTYDTRLPVGQRVIAIQVAGAPLQLDKTYTLATRQFIASGGDGFDMFSDLRPNPYPGQVTRLISDILIDWIQQEKVVAPKVEGRLLDLGAN